MLADAERFVICNTLDDDGQVVVEMTTLTADGDVIVTVQMDRHTAAVIMRNLADTIMGMA